MNEQTIPEQIEAELIGIIDKFNVASFKEQIRFLIEFKDIFRLINVIGEFQVEMSDKNYSHIDSRVQLKLVWGNVEIFALLNLLNLNCELK